MKLDKALFKEHIAYLNDLKDVVKLVNRLHQQDENNTLYSHIFAEDISYQFIYKIERKTHYWELNKYYDNSDKERETYRAQTPEELWDIVSKAWDLEAESEGEVDEQ